MLGTQLITKRLLLRPMEPRDAERVEAYAGDENIAQMTLTMPHPYKLEDAQTFIKITSKDWEEQTGFVFAITRKNEDEIIGAIGLSPERAHHRAEIGYWLGKPFWGKGYVTEAARRVIQFGFEELELERIHAIHFEDNPASGRILQKIGMQQEGILRKHYFRWGRHRNAVCYGILREEFNAE